MEPNSLERCAGTSRRFGLTLHVLLRHRLLLKAGGFEGFGVTEPGPRFDALSVAPCVEERRPPDQARRRWQTSSRSDPGRALGRRGREPRGTRTWLSSENSARSSKYCRTPAWPRYVLRPSVIRSSAGYHTISGFESRDDRFHVAPVPRIDREQGQLHVLLRHRPRSIARDKAPRRPLPGGQRGARCQPKRREGLGEYTAVVPVQRAVRL